MTMTENKKYPIDSREGRVDCPNLELRIGSLLADMSYKAGIDFGVELFESDVLWIENNISKNLKNNNRYILWRLDDAYNNGKSPYFMDYAITFYGDFIDMPGIPHNVNRILIYTVGNQSFWYKQKQLIPPYQHFFIERWLETCR